MGDSDSVVATFDLMATKGTTGTLVGEDALEDFLILQRVTTNAGPSVLLWYETQRGSIDNPKRAPLVTTRIT